MTPIVGRSHSVEQPPSPKKPSRWSLSGAYGAVCDVASATLSAIGLKGSKPKGLPSGVKKQIQKIQTQKEAQNAARVAEVTAQREADKAKAEQAKQKRNAHLSKKQKKKLKARVHQQKQKPADVAQQAPSSSPAPVVHPVVNRSKLNEHLKTAAKVAVVSACVFSAGYTGYLAAPYAIGAVNSAIGAVTTATSTVGSVVGSVTGAVESTALVLSSVPSSASGIANSALGLIQQAGSGLASSLTNAAAPLFAAGVTHSLPQFTVNVNLLDRLSTLIGIPRGDLLHAAAQSQEVCIDPELLRTLDIPVSAPAASLLLIPSALKSNSSSLANTSSIHRFLTWASQPEIRKYGNPVELLKLIASRMIQVSAPQAATQVPFLQSQTEPVQEAVSFTRRAIGTGAALLAGSLFAPKQNRIQEITIEGEGDWSYKIEIELPRDQKNYTKDELNLIAKALAKGVLDQLAKQGSLEEGIPLEIELPEDGKLIAKTLNPRENGEPVLSDQATKKETKTIEFTPTTDIQLSVFKALRSVLVYPTLQAQNPVKRKENLENLKRLFPEVNHQQKGKLKRVAEYFGSLPLFG